MALAATSVSWEKWPGPMAGDAPPGDRACMAFAGTMTGQARGVVTATGARTMALNTLVVLEVLHVFFIRNLYGRSSTWGAVKGTPVIWTCVLAVVVAQFAITDAPPLQAVFETAALNFLDSVLIFFFDVTLFALLELEEQLRLAIATPQGS